MVERIVAVLPERSTMMQRLSAISATLRSWPILVSATAIMHFGLSAPSQLYMSSSQSGFGFTWAELIARTLPMVIVFGAMLWVANRFVLRRAERVAFAVSFASLACLIIGFQFKLFVPDELLAGQRIDWSARRVAMFVEAAVWLIAVIGSWFIPGSMYRRAMMALLLFVGANTLISSVAPALSNLITVSENAPPVGMAAFFTTREKDTAVLDQYSKTKNIVILLVDTLQSDFAESVIAADAELQKSFAGFSFFRNSMGLFPYTGFSIPALLSGEVYKSGESISSYFDTANQQRIENAIDKHGFRSSFLGIWSRLTYVLGRTRATRHEIERFKSVVGYRQYPTAVKAVLFGRDYDFLGNELRSEVHYTRASSTDLGVLQRLAAGIAVEGDTPQFKYIHLWGAHPPFSLNGSDCKKVEMADSRDRYVGQIQCIMNGIASYLAALKSHGVFDQTQIYIVADHGTTHFPIQDGRDGGGAIPAHVQSSAHPTIIFKDFGQRRPLSYSDAPVSLLDVHRTVVATAGAKIQSERDLRKLDSLKGEPRYFYYYDAAKEITGSSIVSFDTYSIDGSVRDQRSWSFVRDPAAPMSPRVDGPMQPFAPVDDAKFTFHSDGVTRFQCALDAQEMKDCPREVSLKGLGQGPHVMKVRAVGGDGRRSELVFYKWGVDVAPPIIAYADGPASRPEEQRAEFRFLISKPGVTMHCRLGNEEFKPCGNPHVIENLTFAGYRLEAKGVDRFGRESAVVPYVWESSPRPPEGGAETIGKQTALSPPLPTFAYAAGPPAPLSQSTEATFRFALPPGLKIRCRMAHEAEFKDCANPTTRRGLALGLNHFEAKAVDATGREGAVVPYVWEIAQP